MITYLFNYFFPVVPNLGTTYKVVSDSLPPTVNRAPQAYFDASAGNTPMMQILVNKNEKPLRFIKPMVEQGADLSAKNALGQSLLHLAVSEGNIEVVEYYLRKGVDPSVHLDMVRDGALVELFSARDHHGDTPYDILNRNIGYNRNHQPRTDWQGKINPSRELVALIEKYAHMWNHRPLAQAGVYDFDSDSETDYESAEEEIVRSNVNPC